MTENLPKDGVQSRQAVAQRCCLKLFYNIYLFFLMNSENITTVFSGFSLKYDQRTIF